MFYFFSPPRHLCGPNSEGMTSNWLVAGLAAALVATAGIVMFKFFRKGGSTTWHPASVRGPFRFEELYKATLEPANAIQRILLVFPDLRLPSQHLSTGKNEERFGLSDCRSLLDKKKTKQNAKMPRTSLLIKLFCDRNLFLLWDKFLHEFQKRLAVVLWTSLFCHSKNIFCYLFCIAF